MATIQQTTKKKNASTESKTRSKGITPDSARKVLNVGGGSKNIPLPPQYAEYAHVLLDIDPRGNPDIVCDARELKTQVPDTYDAIYCSHNLEHYYHHDTVKVLQGFLHVLKNDGFVHIRVPDMKEVMATVVARNLEIDDVLYQSSAGPIMVRDVIYGYGREIEESGSDFYAHKTGFTPQSLRKILHQTGFTHVYVGSGSLEVVAIALKNSPSAYAKTLFNLPEMPQGV